MSEEVYIASFARTPVGMFHGALAETPATELGGIVLRHALLRAGVSGSLVDEVFMGNVLPAGLGQNPARQAAILAGIPSSVGAVTLNKVCGSGLHAVLMAERSIRSGEASIVAAGGMENMTRAPYLLTKGRGGYRIGNAEIVDSMMNDGLTDAYEHVAMGVYAEACAEKYGLTREAQDDFAVVSNLRARASIDSGAFKAEIVPVPVMAGKDSVEFSEDEQPQRFNEAKLRRLRPAFAKQGGTITAGNASSINDGAAAVTVVSEAACREHGIKPIARILGSVTVGGDPEWFTMAPVQAVNKLLAKLSLNVSDVDLFEINEAFAAATLAVMQELGVSQEKTNVQGGAVALGHPIGASGARVLVTLLSALEQRGGKLGVATLCIGGGEAVAMAVERL